MVTWLSWLQPCFFCHTVLPQRFQVTPAVMGHNHNATKPTFAAEGFGLLRSRLWGHPNSEFLRKSQRLSSRFRRLKMRPVRRQSFFFFFSLTFSVCLLCVVYLCWESIFDYFDLVWQKGVWFWSSKHDV